MTLVWIALAVGMFLVLAILALAALLSAGVQMLGPKTW